MTIVRQHWSASTDLNRTHRRICVRSNLVIEAPSPQALAQHRQDRIAVRLTELRQQRFIQVELRTKGHWTSIHVAKHC